MTAVTVVGTGAIGGAVASTLRGGGIPGCTLLAAVNSRSRPDQITAAVEDADVVVEATRTTAAAALIRLAVPAGTDIVLCSAGVLADPSAADLATGPGRILLPAGAIGGLDILSAAARAGGADVAASHTTVKRPGALGLPGLTGAPVEVFRGSAREAARRYPRTCNSSVTLALATVGLDRLEVVVVADPAATDTVHRVTCTSPIGDYRFQFRNAVDESSSGRTSLVTVWSVLQTLAGLHRGFGTGVLVGAGAPS
ncbi:aspartate dehydrogenase domain-containing protein [Mycobacterium sp. smrl_JER01]|uniref:aspartate dehydrogenase domain-containing protein n=1 Tax=Mycobacterium sp. smrl_JER01 TaxID=3402633 RepID=UPI003AC4FAE1